MGDSPGGDRKRSAHWSESDTEILVDLLLKRRESGRTTDNGFKPEVWKEASELLVNAEVGGPKTPTACKSRWQRLQRDYKIVKDIESLPGFRWDRKEHRLLATQETWDLAEQQQQLDSSRYQKLSLPQYDALTILCPPEGIRKRGAGVLKGGRNSLAGDSSISESSSMISLNVSSGSNSTEGTVAGPSGSQARTALPAGLTSYGEGMLTMNGMVWAHPGSGGGADGQAVYVHPYPMASHYQVDQPMMNAHSETHRPPQRPPQQQQPQSNDPTLSPATSTHPTLSPAISNRLAPDNSLNSPQLPPRASPSKRTRHSTRNSVHLSPATSLQYLSPTVEYANPIDGGYPSSTPTQYSHDAGGTSTGEGGSSSSRMPPPHRNSGPTPTTAMPHPGHAASHLSETTPNPSPPSHRPLHQTQTLPFQPQPPTAQPYLLPSPTYVGSGAAYPFPQSSGGPHFAAYPPTTATAAGPHPSHIVLPTGVPSLPSSAHPSPPIPITPEIASAGLSEAQRRTEAVLQLQEKETDMRDEDLVEVMAEFTENVAAADTYLAIKKAALRKLWLAKVIKRRRKG